LIRGDDLMIRRFLILFLISTLSIYCSDNGTDPNNGGQNEIPDLPGWNLVWNDEFNGTQLATTRWNYEVNGYGGGNNELQYYTDRAENSFVTDGKLHIVALEEEYTGPDGTRDYTSARITTKGKGDWKYGRFDIRAKLPYGQGLWPAIWMMPTESVYGGWAASGEIDIMELLGHEPKVTHGTLHYGASYPNNVHSGDAYTLPSGSFASDFHTFTLEWEETEFRWYVDGVHYHTMNDWYTENQMYPAPFDQDFFMILNVAVGGNWPGNPDETTQFPQEMVVDYVRVYEKTQ
jgi:beta-glucanase (GH16 family)